MVALLSLCVAWSLAPVDRVAATTTVRLWHELHARATQAHDFAHMLAPPAADATFVAAVRREELRALALLQRCDEDGATLLQGVACHPDHPLAASQLVGLLTEGGHFDRCGKGVRTQRGILLEVLYRRPDA